MTMNCKDASRWISLMLDGEIPSAEKDALRKHLEECEACREEELSQRRLIEALSSMKAPRQSPERARQLRERVRQTLAVRSLPRTSSMFRTAALAAVLVLSVVVALLSHALLNAQKAVAHLQAETATLKEAASTPAPSFMALFTRNGANGSVVRENLEAFGVVQDYLAGAVRWMAVDGSQVEIGMSGSQPTATAAHLTPGAEILFVTFKYVERGRDGQLKVLSNPQFAMLSDEEAVVRLKPTDGKGNPRFRFRVKASHGADDRINTEVKFEDQGFARNAPTEIESSITAKASLEAAKPVLLGASGDMSRRRELYVWAESRPLPEMESSEDNLGARPL